MFLWLLNVPGLCLLKRTKSKQSKNRVMKCHILIFVFVLSVITNSNSQTVYTWSTSAPSSWTSPGSWMPHRVSPSPTDVLIFDGILVPAANVNGVAGGSIGRLIITNNASVRMTASSPALLKISGGEGHDLLVDNGSQLTLSGGLSIKDSLLAGATAEIEGVLSFESGAHRLLSNDPGCINFTQGSEFKALPGFTGNAFGNSGNSNTVHFKSGARYVCMAGFDPFGLAAPLSKVVFEPGSIYSHETVLPASLSGRMYSDFQLDNMQAVIDVSGYLPTFVRNISVLSGMMTIRNTGVVEISGDINVNAGASLMFDPMLLSPVIFSGSTVHNITSQGLLIFSPRADVTVNGSGSLHFHNSIAIDGNLYVAPGCSVISDPLAIWRFNGAILNNQGIISSSTIRFGSVTTLSGAGTLSSEILEFDVNSHTELLNDIEIFTRTMFVEGMITSGGGWTLCAAIQSGGSIEIGPTAAIQSGLAVSGDQLFHSEVPIAGACVFRNGVSGLRQNYGASAISFAGGLTVESDATLEIPPGKYLDVGGHFAVSGTVTGEGEVRLSAGELTCTGLIAARNCQLQTGPHAVGVTGEIRLLTLSTGSSATLMNDGMRIGRCIAEVGSHIDLNSRLIFVNGGGSLTEPVFELSGTSRSSGVSLVLNGSQITYFSFKNLDSLRSFAVAGPPEVILVGAERSPVISTLVLDRGILRHESELELFRAAQMEIFVREGRLDTIPKSFPQVVSIHYENDSLEDETGFELCADCDDVDIEILGKKGKKLGKKAKIDTIKVKNGWLDLNGNVAVLDNYGHLTEYPGHTVRGNSGYIETSRIDSVLMNQTDVGGLGLVVSNQLMLDSIRIRRGHAVQYGNSNSGIGRYFDIFTDSLSASTFDLEFKYDSTEVSGFVRTRLRLYSSSDGGVTWNHRGGIADTSEMKVSLNNIPVRSERWTLADSTAPLSLEQFAVNVKIYSEGTYDPLQNNAKPDTLTCKLYDIDLNLITAQTVISSQSGQFTFTLTPLLSVRSSMPGSTYYIAVNSRNTIETWSRSGGEAFVNGVLNYDYTVSESMAYGNNMKQVDNSPVSFAMFSGDVNQDGFIDGVDLGFVDNDAQNFVTGFSATDLNGDEIVDASDYALADNNALNYISVQRP